MEAHYVIMLSLAGTLMGALLFCIPGLHVASVLAVGLALLTFEGEVSGTVPFIVALVSTYAVVGFIPLVLLSVPDEGLFAAVTPSQQMLTRGYGMRAVHLGGAGAFAGIVLSGAMLGLMGRHVLPVIRDVMRPHWHWVVWAVVLFMLMSEWPYRVGPGLRREQRLRSAWGKLLSGLAIFVMSALLGMIVFFRAKPDPVNAFAGIMPMLTGMFSVPFLLVAIISDPFIPDQQVSGGGLPKREASLHGCLSGWLGGALAGVIPGVTAGVGGLLAGHTCSLKSQDGFVLAQGCARGTYLVGGLMLMFVPGAAMTRGSSAMIVSVLHAPFPQIELLPLIAVSVMSSAVSLLLCPTLFRFLLALVKRSGVRWLSACALVLILILNTSITGWWGFAVMLAGTLIGIMPILCGARRMNCLGCILVPVGMALSGLSDVW